MRSGHHMYKDVRRKLIVCSCGACIFFFFFCPRHGVLASRSKSRAVGSGVGSSFWSPCYSPIHAMKCFMSLVSLIHDYYTSSLQLTYTCYILHKKLKCIYIHKCKIKLKIINLPVSCKNQFNNF